MFQEQDNQETENNNNVVKLPLETNLQYHLLKMMINSETFLTKIDSHLKEEYFDNALLGWFYKTISKYYRDFKKSPELSTVKNEMLKFDIKDRAKYERIFEKIEASDYGDEEYLLKELTGWLRSRKFIQLHKTAAEIYNDNNRESAYEITSRSISELKELDLTVDKVIDFNQVHNVIEQASQTNIYRIPIGIPEIDHALRGGLPKQTLTTIVGYTNAGKSVVLLNIAYNAMAYGKKVLFLYHEGCDEQMILRLLSRQTGIAYAKFFDGMSVMSEYELKKIEEAKAIFNERLILKPWQKFGTTVEDVITYCRKKKAEFDYDLVIDDYAQLLMSKSAGDGEFRHNMAAVYRGLSQMAAELKVAAVTAAQSNKTAGVDILKGRRLMNLADIAECFEIARCSECVITLSKSNKDEVNNRLKILLAKQRDGKANVGVDCKTDFEHLIAYDRKLGIEPLRLTDNQELIDYSEGQATNGQLVNNVLIGAPAQQ